MNATNTCYLLVSEDFDDGWEDEQASKHFKTAIDDVKHLGPIQQEA